MSRGPHTKAKRATKFLESCRTIVRLALTDALDCCCHKQDFAPWKGVGLRVPYVISSGQDSRVIIPDVVVHHVHIEHGIQDGQGASQPRTIKAWMHHLEDRKFVRPIHQDYVVLDINKLELLDVFTEGGNLYSALRERVGDLSRWQSKEEQAEAVLAAKPVVDARLMLDGEAEAVLTAKPVVDVRHARVVVVGAVGHHGDLVVRDVVDADQRNGDASHRPEVCNADPVRQDLGPVVDAHGRQAEPQVLAQPCQHHNVEPAERTWQSHGVLSLQCKDCGAVPPSREDSA